MEPGRVGVIRPSAALKEANSKLHLAVDAHGGARQIFA